MNRNKIIKLVAKKKILKTIKYILLIIVGAFIILFIILFIQMNNLKKNVSVDWHDKAEKEINDANKRMPLEQKQYIDSIRNNNDGYASE